MAKPKKNNKTKKMTDYTVVESDFLKPNSPETISTE